MILVAVACVVHERSPAAWGWLALLLSGAFREAGLDAPVLMRIGGATP
jgi:hypothetical protein